MAARDPGVTRRHGLLGALAGGAALAAGGDGRTAAARGAAPPRRLAVTDSALPAASRPRGGGGGPQGPFRTAEFDMVGVFDADWLLDTRYARLLDTMAASPGGFGAVRFFGALNSGVREDVFPTSTGRVWPRPDAPMDFSATLDALAALTSRGLVPFVALTFFPQAIGGASPIEPPADLGPWQALVRAFLDRAAERFGREEIGRWWFEAWNEPNMPPFWRGSFDRYLDLYRATSEAVLASGHAVRLGGPALAYMPPREGPELMERFLEFLAREPGVKCDFLSLHRKGVWVEEEGEPLVERLVAAAEATAEAALRLVPERCRRGLPIVNNEADMKVGFATPYEPRLSERFPAWLAALAVAHDALGARYADRGLRFLAAADNANQHLVREPFDGRRSLMVPTSAGRPEDLLKLPVFGFYEMLRLLGDRHGTWDAPEGAFFPRSDLFHAITVGEGRVAALFARHPGAVADGGALLLDYGLADIPWERVNLAQFRIDATHSNAFAAVGRRMPATLDPVRDARRIRAAQELGVAAPIRTGLRVGRGGRLRLPIRLGPYATALVWVTPFERTPPATPRWLGAAVEGGNAVLRWTPNTEARFWSYELRRRGPGAAERRISPVPLRAATWVDTAPPAGEQVYEVRAVSASGIRTPWVRSPPLRVP